MSIRVSFLGLGIDEMAPSEAVEKIRDLWRTRLKSRIFFVNAHCFNVAAANERYRDSLRAADLVLADGSGMLLASRVLRVPIQHNLNGTDLIPMLCDAAAEEGRSIFLNIAFLARGAGAGHIQGGAAGTTGGLCRQGRPRYHHNSRAWRLNRNRKKKRQWTGCWLASAALARNVKISIHLLPTFYATSRLYESGTPI